MQRDFRYNRDFIYGHRLTQSSPVTNADKDRALLVALLFILIKDGGDEMLIMALLYILS